MANALYAYDTASRKVISSSPPQGGLWGVAGPAIGNDGTIYFESGDHPYDAKAGLLSTSFQAYTFSQRHFDAQGLLHAAQSRVAD